MATGEPLEPKPHTHLPPDLENQVFITRAPSLLEVQDPLEAIKPINDAVRNFGDEAVTTIPLEDGSTIVHVDQGAYEEWQKRMAFRALERIAPSTSERETPEPTA